MLGLSPNFFILSNNGASITSSIDLFVSFVSFSIFLVSVSRFFVLSMNVMPLSQLEIT